MDAAQMINSAVVPGAATLQSSAEFPSGTAAASPLFRETFSKAALAVGASLEQQSAAGQSGLPGNLSVNSKGAGIAVQLLARSGGEALPEQGPQEMSGVPEGQLGTLLARTMAHRQTAGGNALNPEQRGLALHNDREKTGEVEADLSAGQLETELLSGAEILLTSAVSTREKKVEGVDSDGTAQESPWLVSADGAGSPASTMLPAGLASVPVSVPVVRNISHGFTAESDGVSTMPVFPGAGGNIPTAGTELRPLPAEAAGSAKTAGLEIPAAFPELKEMAGVVPGGATLVGKDQGNEARQENGPVTKQVPHDQNPAGKGETVLRELPRGVTVLNPAQTFTTGRPAMTADAAPLAVQGTERGRIFPQEGEAREEQGRQISLAGEGEKIARNTEGFSSQNNSNLGHDSTSHGGNHAVPQTAAASGSFEAVAKGQLEPLSEVPREHEVSELHQNILSQVREKLVNQDPSGTVSKISLKLNPHELGELQINVRLEDQKMRVDITAQNPVVKEALLQNIDQLKETLMRQNISMERFHVSTGDGGQAFNQSFREGRQAAQQTPDNFTYPLSGYYQEDPRVSQAAYADARENSLVDMRF